MQAIYMDWDSPEHKTVIAEQFIIDVIPHKGDFINIWNNAAKDSSQLYEVHHVVFDMSIRHTSKSQHSGAFENGVSIWLTKSSKKH